MKMRVLHKIWWLWVPLGFAVVQAGIEGVLPYDIRANIHNENGPHELLQFVVMAVALFVAGATLWRMDLRRDKFVTFWIGLAALCCLYVAGEELSWGQQILQWSTPEFWHQVNDQGETNLHNTSSWLDQKPRLLLLIGVGVGGLIFPALQKWKPGTLPERFAVIYPPACLGVVAALAIGANLVDKVFEAFTDHPLLSRGSEVEELYLFYFVLLYLVVLRRRVLS